MASFRLTFVVDKKNGLIYSMYIISNLTFTIWLDYPLKGQSHEKVGEIRVEGDSLGPN
jgi:hypothetical protein